MSKIRHHTHRRDDNHDAVVKECERAGLLVEDIHNGGIADILVARSGLLYLIEIKAPGKRKNLTPLQMVKHIKWNGYIYVVESAEEIFKIVGLK